MNVRVLIAIVVIAAVNMFAQPNATLDTPFQVRYAANVDLFNTPGDVDSVVNITNTGFTNAPICVNVYAFDAGDEQMVSCCSYVVTPNANVSISVKYNLVINPLTPATPDSVVVKLLATTNAGSCNAAVPGPMTAGLAAYMSTAHVGGPPYNAPYLITETPFTPASPGAAEIARISALCGFIQANGSGYGVCGLIPE